jgi:hypothetical protein
MTMRATGDVLIAPLPKATWEYDVLPSHAPACGLGSGMAKVTGATRGELARRLKSSVGF